MSLHVFSDHLQVLVAVLIMSGAIAVPFLTITWAQQQQQNMTSSPPPNNATTATATAAKPVDGYEKPEGHLTAIRHLFDDPSLRVHITASQMTRFS
jgi:hypothetical protein